MKEKLSLDITKEYYLWHVRAPATMLRMAYKAALPEENRSGLIAARVVYLFMKRVAKTVLALYRPTGLHEDDLIMVELQKIAEQCLRDR